MDMLLKRYTDRYVAGDCVCGVGCCRVPTNMTDMQVLFNNNNVRKGSQENTIEKVPKVSKMKHFKPSINSVF